MFQIAKKSIRLKKHFQGVYLRQWKGKPESAAFAEFTVRAYPPAMFFNDFLRNIKPKS